MHVEGHGSSSFYGWKSLRLWPRTQALAGRHWGGCGNSRCWGAVAGRIGEMVLGTNRSQFPHFFLHLFFFQVKGNLSFLQGEKLSETRDGKSLKAPYHVKGLIRRSRVRVS